MIPIAFNFPPVVLLGRELQHDALTEDSDRLEALVSCHIIVVGSAVCLDSIYLHTTSAAQATSQVIRVECKGTLYRSRCSGWCLIAQLCSPGPDSSLCIPVGVRISHWRFNVDSGGLPLDSHSFLQCNDGFLLA